MKSNSNFKGTEKGIVICKLPKAGLGNQLFPLMKAFTFAHLNQLPVLVTNYRQMKIGVWLRGEKNKRNYKGFFTFEKGFLSQLRNKFKAKKYKNKICEVEPAIKLTKIKRSGVCVYLFSQMPHWENYFDGLKQNRDLVIRLFLETLEPKVVAQVNATLAPCIGVHIRMGDFRKLKEGENFRETGTVRTPENYFIDIIKKIRKIHGTSLPVSVFTDGYKREFNQLFLLENVELVEGNNDLVDMLLLSKSRVIITSAGSTFSYWSAFLSDAVVIMHPDHTHKSLRPEEVDIQFFEGPFDENNERLIRLIHSINEV